MKTVCILTNFKGNRGDKPSGQGLRPDARQRAKTQSVCASQRDRVKSILTKI